MAEAQVTGWMMKTVLWIVLPALLLFAGIAAAQDQDRMAPMLEKGTKELGFTGHIDFEGPGGGVDFDVDLRYGYFQMTTSLGGGCVAETILTFTLQCMVSFPRRRGTP